MSNRSDPPAHDEITDTQIIGLRIKEVKENRKAPNSHRFVAIRGKVVMRGQEFICRAASQNMAHRIANALNYYAPNEKGR